MRGRWHAVVCLGGNTAAGVGGTPRLAQPCWLPSRLTQAACCHHCCRRRCCPAGACCCTSPNRAGLRCTRPRARAAAAWLQRAWCCRPSTTRCKGTGKSRGGPSSHFTIGVRGAGAWPRLSEAAKPGLGQPASQPDGEDEAAQAKAQGGITRSLAAIHGLVQSARCGSAHTSGERAARAGAAGRWTSRSRSRAQAGGCRGKSQTDCQLRNQGCVTPSSPFQVQTASRAVQVSCAMLSPTTSASRVRTQGQGAAMRILPAQQALEKEGRARHAVPGGCRVTRPQAGDAAGHRSGRKLGRAGIRAGRPWKPAPMSAWMPSPKPGAGTPAGSVRGCMTGWPGKHEAQGAREALFSLRAYARAGEDMVTTASRRVCTNTSLTRIAPARRAGAPAGSRARRAAHCSATRVSRAVSRHVQPSRPTPEGLLTWRPSPGRHQPPGTCLFCAVQCIQLVVGCEATPTELDSGEMAQHVLEVMKLKLSAAH